MTEGLNYFTLFIFTFTLFMTIPIAHLPAQILRKPTKDIVFPLSKDMKRLIKDMLATVKKADGIGLAAPQVSKDLNFAIIYLEEMGVPPFAIFNPKITKASKEQIEIEEGCLSMPGLFGMVSRPKKITIEFQDFEGAKHVITDDGWLARVIQHEVDHLNNVLIIDKFRTITRGEELLKKYQ